MNEIILYQPNEIAERIEVRLEDDTVWLTQAQMALLFNQTKQNVSLHINNCFREGELEKIATVKESLTVQKEGNRMVKRKLEYYNLDVIISVGYRVKSKQGTQFRIWSTQVLRDYLLKGYAVNRRMDRIEDDVHFLKEKVKKIDVQLNTTLPKNQGIFFDGQIFDAYVFICDLIKSAKKEIILIDNYIDESVLQLLTKRMHGVSVIIYTPKITKTLQLDIAKHNAQHEKIKIHTFAKSHDRFLIIDEQVYHFGASLKDLGKKWFAFSKMQISKQEIVKQL